MSILNDLFANKAQTETTTSPAVPMPTSSAVNMPVDPAPVPITNASVNPTLDPVPTQLPEAVTTTQTTVDPIAQSDKSVLSHLDDRATQVMVSAVTETKRLQKPLLEPDQLLYGLLSDKGIFKLLGDFSVNTADLTRQLQSVVPTGTFTGEPTLSDQTKQILEDAYISCKQRKVDFVSPEDILLAMFAKNSDATSKLQMQGVDKGKVEQKLENSAEFKTGKRSFLAQYGIDLTEKAETGQLDPVTGRDTEITRLIHILMRRTKNNPIIIGDAGVGKTAIVEGLAEMMAQKKVAPELATKRIIQLDVSSLVAGASHRGEFEERLQNIIRETMASNGQIILFIDEIHTLIGAGETEGALDASNIIKPYLSRGQLQIIGTTTTAEYRKYFEKDRAFERRFQPVMADEPSEEKAEEMIKILQPKYETFHKVVFTPEAIKSAVHLSKRYIGERFLPDKAIDLMDEAASEVKLEVAAGKRQSNQVTEEDIEKIVSRWTGIPITKLTEKESEKLLHLENLIHKKFINQEHAVKAVSEAVRRGRIGLANANRPIASFIFLGPTGTGKTELAKVLAEIMFGRSDAMIRLDMSEYMEKHEVAKLVGAPPGYVGYEEGGQLTEAVRRKPYSIVLLDEIEKAHPDVFNILLQLLEDGRLTDNKGNTISFKNTVIIATSNIGSNLIREKLALDQQKEEDKKELKKEETSSVAALPTTPGLVQPTKGQEDSEKLYKEMSKIVNTELNKFFKPEVINRFDEIVIFEPLNKANMIEIAKLQIEGVKKMLKEQDVEMQISQAALGELAKEGYDPVYGARPLRRLIQRVIENPLAIYLINKSINPKDMVIVDYNTEKDQFSFMKGNPTPAANQPVGGGQQPVVTTPSTVQDTNTNPISSTQLPNLTTDTSSANLSSNHE